MTDHTGAAEIYALIRKAAEKMRMYFTASPSLAPAAAAASSLDFACGLMEGV
jgi:hypothetical protein